MSDAASHWYFQVLDKFENIDKILAQRLGQANCQRFDDLRQLKEKDLPISLPRGVHEPEKSTFRPPTTIRDSGLGTSIITPVMESNRKAASVTSGSSFASNDEESTSRRVPKTPAAVARLEPFECEICGQTVLLRTRKQWK
jgi:hypothetical protein